MLSCTAKPLSLPVFLEFGTVIASIQNKVQIMYIGYGGIKIGHLEPDLLPDLSQLRIERLLVTIVLMFTKNKHEVARITLSGYFFISNEMKCRYFYLIRSQG